MFASSRQCSQRRRMGRCAQAHRGAISGNISPIYFRADAGFANPEVYEYLEAEGIKYAIRLPANSVLQGRIGYLLTRSVGRPPNVVRCYSAPGDCQGRMASGRTLSAWLYSHQHEPPGRARRCFLQQARNMRAMDQGRQGRDQMDAAVMSDVRRERRPSPTSCAGLQSRQFPAHFGDAGADQGLVTDESEGEAHQDRREGRHMWTALHGKHFFGASNDLVGCGHMSGLCRCGAYVRGP